MNTDSNSAILHFKMIWDLANRLSETGMAIYRHQYSVLAFGSWEIIFGTRHHKFKAIFDGKEQVLTVEECRCGDSQSKENWNHHCDFYKTDSLKAAEEIYVLSGKII